MKQDADVVTPTTILVYDKEGALLPEITAALPAHTVLTHVTSWEGMIRAAQAPSVAAYLIVVTSPLDLNDTVLADLQLTVQSHPLVCIVRETQIPVSEVDRLNTLSPARYVAHPFDPDALRVTLANLIRQAPGRQADRALEATLAEVNRRLNARLQEINTVYTMGKSVVSSLDVDQVLERAVSTSVNLTQADDGFIVLRDGDRLFVHIAKYKGDQVPDRRRVETSDRIAWQVIRSGRPAMLHRETKIATGMLVRSLLYVPLQVPDSGTIGVLGVVNRSKTDPFSESQLFALSSVADFAAIAIENAQLFAAREAERERLSAILQQAAEVIVVTDLEDRLWLWSERAAAILGIASEARGRALHDAIQEAQVCEFFDRARYQDSAYHAEITLENGRVFDAHLSTIDRVGRVMVMQEITHFKELDRLRSEFVSTVSHDLRTPLTAIQGYIELLDRAGPLNEMQRDFVQRAVRSLSHVTDLISDLLDIGRIEAGYDFEMQAVRLDRLAREVVEATRISAAREGITLSVEVASEPLWVWGNERRLRQVLDNLISNGIKYNHPRGWVKVQAHREDGHIAILVSDSGIGIPVEEQSRIFERLYRVQSPETEGIEGTGLGLAIVKSVVERHKGRIWVESAPGQGSTFTILLPRYLPEDAAG